MLYVFIHCHKTSLFAVQKPGNAAPAFASPNGGWGMPEVEINEWGSPPTQNGQILQEKADQWASQPTNAGQVLQGKRDEWGSPPISSRQGPQSQSEWSPVREPKAQSTSNARSAGEADGWGAPDAGTSSDWQPSEGGADSSQQAWGKLQNPIPHS